MMEMLEETGKPGVNTKRQSSTMWSAGASGHLCHAL